MSAQPCIGLSRACAPNGTNSRPAVGDTLMDDDEFLTRYRQAPRPEFARRLQDRLEQGETMNTKRNWLQTLVRWSPAALAAAIVLAAVPLFTFPPAQAWAQGFLDVFRVKKFATITIDPSRMEQAQEPGCERAALLSDDVKVIKDPGKPVNVQSVADAGKRAGFTVAVPLGCLRAPSWRSRWKAQGRCNLPPTAKNCRASSTC